MCGHRDGIYPTVVAAHYCMDADAEPERPWLAKSSRSVPPRSRRLRLDALEQFAMTLDSLVQRLVVAFRDHVVQHFQRAARAGAERHLRERQTCIGTGALRDRSPLVDHPWAAQREGGHINCPAVA
jgi:hypothetical protein